MVQAYKMREVLVCEQVAEEINKDEGTDYYAIAAQTDFPDVLLKSRSGEYRPREAEVVSTPQDFTIRYDNKNVQKFERQLRLALQDLKLIGYNISVRWSEPTIRFGVESALIRSLAALIKANASASSYLFLRGVEIYKQSHKLSQIVHYVHISPVPYPKLEVRSASGWWGPSDGRWIEEAVISKLKKYGHGSLTKNLLLVIDGLSYIDSEQMVAFRDNNPPEKIPFAELWVVTMGRAYRLKSKAP